MQPEVSVILPFYNAGDNLEESIKSILNQNYRDFELILIDNNSGDKSWEIATKIADTDSRIKLISESKNGLSFAINTGIENSSGKYIAFSSTHSTSNPDRLSLQYEFLERNSEIDLIASCARYTGNSNNNYGISEYIQWYNRLITYEDIHLNQFAEPPVLLPSVMVRTEVFKKYGAAIPGYFPQDYELCLRLLHNGVKMYKLTNALVDLSDPENNYNDTRSNMSSNAFYEMKSSYMYDWLKIHNEFFPEIAVWGAGRNSRQRFSFLHDLGVTPKFFIDQWPNPERNVIDFRHTPPAGKNFIISYVTNREARVKIKEFLVNLGYSEGKDFICVT